MQRSYLFCSILLVLFSIQPARAQITGFIENFDDNTLTGWEAPNSGTFMLAEAGGQLRISYNRTATSTEWDNFNFIPPQVNISNSPLITLKARSGLACELAFKPVYLNGGNEWLTAALPGDNAWHSYAFSLSGAGETVLSRIYMYLDGGTKAAKSGVVYFDDLCIGDSAKANLTVNDDELAAALIAASALYVNTTEGTAEGEYPADSKAALQDVIDRARAIAGKSGAAQSEIDQAAWDLLDACVELEKQANVPNPGLIDPQASAKTKHLYQNLDEGCGQRLLFGMHDATGYGVGWKGDDDRSDVKDVCGDYPAVYSWDMNKLDGGPDPDESRSIYRIRSAFARGGVNTMCWHQYDPRGRSFYGKNLPGENIVITLLPGGSYHQFYKNRLTRIARFLKGLRGDDGHAIPIIFRPYHEHDGGAFWWGASNCSAEEYNRIWQFTVTFLRDSLNVHNLIYAISPINFTTRSEYLAIYPGDAYVDILGMDFYFWPGSPLDTRQITFINTLHIPVQLAQERAKVAALTEVGYENLPEPSWFSRYLLPPFKSDSLAARMSYAVVWRNESTTHHFAPFPGHATVPGFIAFYNDPFTAFEQDLPPMYVAPGLDAEPPHFVVQPESAFVATNTLVSLYLETDERAHLRYGSSDIPYAEMPGRFQAGQGGFKHSTSLPCLQGESQTLFIRAIDLSGNESPRSLRVTFKVDTLQRAIPWHDARYPSSDWKTGKAPLGFGAAAGNATTTAAAKTIYYVASFDLPQPVAALGLLVKCHDGAAVYLNGHELVRYNLPAAAEILHSTSALSGSKNNQIYMFTPAALQMLQIGNNLLAVEVHTADLASVDLSLDARIWNQTKIYLDLGSTWRFFDSDLRPPVFTLADYLSGVGGADAALSAPVQKFALAQNYPNPFNPETAISYQLAKTGQVRLDVYDITGRLVQTLVNARQSGGAHKVKFQGEGLPSGVYLCRLQAEGQIKVRRMLLLR